MMGHIVSITNLKEDMPMQTGYKQSVHHKLNYSPTDFFFSAIKPGYPTACVTRNRPRSREVLN